MVHEQGWLVSLAWSLVLTSNSVHLMGSDLSLVLLTLGLAWARRGNAYRVASTAWLEGSTSLGPAPLAADSIYHRPKAVQKLFYFIIIQVPLKR